MTFRSAIFASFVRMSSCTPSAKAAAFSFSSLRFSNGRTAIPFVTGCRINSLFQTIHPAAATSATSDAASSALVGLRRIHFFLARRFQCVGLGSAHALASVPNLRPGRERKNTGAVDLSRGICGKLLRGRDLFSDLTDAVAAAQCRAVT